ncbi:MAG: amino acid adenylation domain-containing protein, partial [bacterium]|nr:amino acid adenylation domain-containing protein [bacterium]
MSLMSLKSAAPPLVKSGKQEYYPVSLQQQGVYLQSMIDPDNTVWNTSHSWRYQGPFHLEAFNKAVLQLVQRQAALRTNFHLKKDKIFQQVNEPGETTDPFFTFTDISTYPQREQMDMAKSIEDEEANQSYNLTESPLVRFHVVRFTHNDHLIIISKHHIISDVTSRQLLRRELIELYNANVTGEPHNLEPLGIQYYDYAVWQQDFFESSYYDAQRKYWLNELSGTLPVLNVPLDFSRKENRRLKSATSEILLDTEMVPAIRTFALRNRVPFSSIFLLAFYILLSKHSGQEDIVVGTLYRGRNFDKKNMGKIIGLFVNRIAVRLNLGSDDDHDHSLRDLLTKVDKKTREAFKNQDFLFEELIRAIHPERTEDHAPVFQVVFNMIKVPTIKTEFHGLTQSQWQGTELDSNIASQYDLTIYVRDDLENIGIKLLYSQNLFLRSTIRRLLDQYNGILNTLINRKEETFSQLEIITEEERHRLLEEFNATAVDYPAEKSIHQLFKEQAERTPEQTAVLQDGSLTYKELDNKSDQLALLLREKGVEPGANPIVALMMERTPDMMTAIFGVLKAGAAYLPIGPQFPQERIDFMLKDSGASIIVGNDLIVKRLNGSSAVIGKPANHAYVIYTSGSTGIPKGVVLGHCAVHNFFIGMSEIIDFSAGKTILALTTISFDIFVLETLLPLCRGLKVVLANETHQKDLKSLEALIIDEEVEMMQATPTRMQLFTVNREKESALRNLKELMVGGEALPLKLLEDLKQMTSARIYNMYGPTETTVWSAVKELTKAQTITIGGPIANTQLYILNKNNNLQPIGVVGDLWIGGDGLAEGYLNRPKLTSEVFVNNKYKTGDMARWLSDGTIEFLGRIDHQVKIRGFRIELGEIEAALNKYPGISESAVVAVENSTGGKSLCAYAVTLENKELDIPKLREYLGEKLTEYMIPSYFMRMDQFPLTHNNKIDRKALPAPAIEGMPRSEVDYEAPGDDVQQKLADVWQEVLGVEQVGIHDQFFVLGGDSIKAIQAAAKLSVFGYELDISLLFKYPTIQKLSQHIKIKQPPEAARTGKRKEEDAPDHAEMERIYHSADPKNISKIYNLSPMQEGMLYHYMVDSEGLNRTAYA